MTNSLIGMTTVNKSSPDEKRPLPELIVTRGDGIPLPDQKAALEAFKAQCTPPIDEHRPMFPGTASMYASQHRMAVTQEWMRGWNACLDAIDRLGGFKHG